MALLTDEQTLKDIEDFDSDGTISRDLVADIRQLTRDLEAADAARVALNDKHQRTTIEVRELRAIITQHQHDLEAAKAENVELYDRYCDETERANKIVDELTVAKNALAELKAENDRLTSEDESLTQQLVNVLHDLAEAIAERDKFFDQLSLILNSDSQTVDWEASLETNETPPRPVRVTGKSKGAIDYVVVEIYGEDTSTGSQFDNPNGEYAASKQGGFIRGRLAVRNKFGLAELRRENERLTEALGHATGIAGFSPLNCSECANIEALAAKA